MLAKVSPPRLATEDIAARMPASDRIRDRLISAGQRYHANDNIADFIEDGELGEL